jgi:hypothetical protein
MDPGLLLTQCGLRALTPGWKEVSLLPIVKESTNQFKNLFVLLHLISAWKTMREKEIEMAQNERRLFIKSLILGAGALLVAPAVRIQQVFAGEMVKDSDPLVKALGYVPNAKDSKDRKDKKAQCGNCNFFMPAKPGDKQGKCQVIASGEVAAAGYCRSYSVKVKKA